MAIRFWIGTFVAVLALLPVTGNCRAEEADASLDAQTEPWTGDLDGMVARRTIRVLVPYSMSFYFIDQDGNQRGISYELMREFDDALNHKLKSGNLRVNVEFIPVARDQLLPSLVAGRGDIVAANLTITPERLKLVDFTVPLATGIKEVVVTGPGGPNLTSLDDLAGQQVFIRQSTSYFESLTALNAKFAARGLPEMDLVPAPGYLEVGDMLEMTNAGLVKIVMADLYLAQFWQQAFPNITVHEDLAIREGGEIAFAIRKNSPLLKAELDPFIEKHHVGSTLGNILFDRYLKSMQWVKGAASETELEKFKGAAALFRKYGERYDIDWILMAAQGYQESELDQSTRSKAGAVGIMQIMPVLAKELDVGDIHEVEPNIHAGTKYIRYLIDQYFADEPIDEENKVLFAFAAYNAGPARIRTLRDEAEKRDLDPNLWFDNVEIVAAKRVGCETVQYVRNIYKYYVAYKLMMGQQALRDVPVTTP